MLEVEDRLRDRDRGVDAFSKGPKCYRQSADGAAIKEKNKESYLSSGSSEIHFSAPRQVCEITVGKVKLVSRPLAAMYLVSAGPAPSKDSVSTSPPSWETKNFLPEFSRLSKTSVQQWEKFPTKHWLLFNTIVSEQRT